MSRFEATWYKILFERLSEPGRHWIVPITSSVLDIRWTVIQSIIRTIPNTPTMTTYNKFRRTVKRLIAFRGDAIATTRQVLNSTDISPHQKHISRHVKTNVYFYKTIRYRWQRISRICSVWKPEINSKPTICNIELKYIAYVKDCHAY